VPELDYNQVFSVLKDAIRIGKGFSFVRCGDGEGIVLGFPKFTNSQNCLARFAKWFDTTGMSRDTMLGLAEQIREACRTADLIGLPAPRHNTIDQRWRNVRPFMASLGLTTPITKTCSMDTAIELQVRDGYRQLLKDRDVTCITCRNVQAPLMNLGVKSVKFFYLPPQRRPCMGRNWSGTERHYPDRYSALSGELEAAGDLHGRIHLVGAGGLGKIYCMWVKQHNGIAIDIGSVFDGWAQLPTRTYLRQMIERFKIAQDNPRVER
jgi:hypothetical protein